MHNTNHWKLPKTFKWMRGTSVINYSTGSGHILEDDKRRKWERKCEKETTNGRTFVFIYNTLIYLQ